MKYCLVPSISVDLTADRVTADGAPEAIWSTSYAGNASSFGESVVQSASS